MRRRSTTTTTRKRRRRRRRRRTGRAPSSGWALPRELSANIQQFAESSSLYLAFHLTKSSKGKRLNRAVYLRNSSINFRKDLAESRNFSLLKPQNNPKKDFPLRDPENGYPPGTPQFGLLSKDCLLQRKANRNPRNLEKPISDFYK